MTTAKVEQRIEAPAEKVWPLVSWQGIAGIAEQSVGKMVFEGDGIGATRVITMPNGATIVETLEENDEGRAYKYSLADNPGMPWSNYIGQVILTPDGAEACVLVFQSDFTAVAPEEACIELYTGTFQATAKAVQDLATS